MEACASAHHWARTLHRFGHTVRLMAPQFVKPYVKTNKNDVADAEAICEAVGRPSMRFVPIKSIEQQAILSVHRLKIRLLPCFGALILVPAVVSAGVVGPGLYRNDAGQRIYVGVEVEVPAAAVNQYFDPRTRHTGDLRPDEHLSLLKGIEEEPRIIDSPNGQLAASLYYVGSGRRATIILIHGNDPETREMGFIIPYFVLNGVNVISYDQRGTGRSAGNWQQNGPTERATDVAEIYDEFVTDPHVIRESLGLWGFSNGGWTAPIVATTRPVAFMILKSGPAESIEENVYYSVEQHMRQKHYDAAAISSAIDTWHSLIGALSGALSWDAARTMYTAASTKSWFADSYIPFFIPPDPGVPPPAAAAEGMRRELLYDPATTLQQVHTPTLALFGALDRNVDVAHSPTLFESAFDRAGMHDFTMHIYKDAGHTLKVSATGFNDEPSQPEQLTAGYPGVMIQWLRQRNFLLN
jgi:pimeloyl-ACP methyl ester carboxylesterase